MYTLAWESLADQAPTVSSVHNFAGSVYTDLHKDVPGLLSREQQVFLGTSMKYMPRMASAKGVPSGDLAPRKAVILFRVVGILGELD
jgi:hypothetical protein